MSRFPNVTKWYSKIKKSLVGYDAIQDAAVVFLKQLLERISE
jgi:hypothetical protein